MDVILLLGQITEPYTGTLVLLQMLLIKNMGVFVAQTFLALI